MTSAVPLVLLFGPSGAGKSTLGKALADRQGWLHIEADGQSVGVTSAPAPRSMAGAFTRPRGVEQLASDLRRLAMPSRRGAVISFTSMEAPTLGQFAAARAAGFSVLYLVGSQEDCLRAFLRREAATGRQLTERHWQAHNAAMYRYCDKPAYQPFQVQAFRDGAHRPVEDLVAEVLQRCRPVIRTSREPVPALAQTPLAAASRRFLQGSR